MNLDAIAQLARLTEPDGRPDWLKTLKHASDPDALYYRFFYELSQRLAGARLLEIGTDRGVSAAHLAAHLQNHVTTVDNNPQATANARGLGLPNVEAIHADSTVACGQLGSEGRLFDVAFVDGLHTFNQAYGEYLLCRALVKDGGFIFFDDIHLDMHTREMDVFWDHVIDPKLDLSHLHVTGFGVCQVARAIEPPPWRTVIDEASRRMQLHAARSAT